MVGVNKHRAPSFNAKFWIDWLIWSAAVPLAYFARFDATVPAIWLPSMLTATVIGMVAKFVLLVTSKLYLQTWRSIAFRDLAAIVRVVAAASVVLGGVAFLLRPGMVIPRSIPLLDGLFSLLLLLMVRALQRYRHENRAASTVATENRRRVLIIGAGDAGTLIAREMLRHPETGLEPVGFLDDDAAKKGQRIATVPVLGPIDEIEGRLDALAIDEVLIAAPSLGGVVVRDVIERTSMASREISYRIIPSIHEVLAGNVTIDRVRKVEVEDLLRRPPVDLDLPAISSYLSDRVVMVTGAGGSIGSELVRQVCRFGPSLLVLFGRGENSLYALERELDRNHTEISYRSVVGDVRDRGRLEQAFGQHRPAVVFHAAAHKHVPLMEANPEEAVRNNIVGTKNVAELAVAHGVTHLVNISTDKAVNPTSIMGASKRIGELLLQNAARGAGPEQALVSVRFGNVLGSRGSVVPLFEEQIRNGGPVTVTHRDMQRYFMTIPEATQLVLQAASHGRNGEIYILDMGEPVLIYDLARDLILLSGLEPGEDIEIVFSGMRPGEKLYEELVSDSERDGPTPHPSIFVARPSAFEPEHLLATVNRLELAALEGEEATLRTILAELIEGSQMSPVGNA